METTIREIFLTDLKAYTITGYDRAIVTDIAGTTRDTLTEKINISGITLNITDTAGIHETEDVIEKIGVDKAYDSMKMSDLILYVCDGSKPLNEDDEDIYNVLREKNLIDRVICIVNKKLNLILVKSFII